MTNGAFRWPEPIARLLLSFDVAAYRWLWSSHCLYIVGLVMSRLALGWLVLTLTDSPLWVGIAAAVDGAGKIITGFFAGVAVDHWDKRRVLFMAQLTFGLLAFTLGGLIVSGQVAIWQVLIFAFLLGGADAVLVPANSAIVYQTVGRARMMNAAALNMLGFNVARTLGAAVAGNVMDRWGVGVCFLIVGGVAWAGLIPLLGVRGVFRFTGEREPFLGALRDGVRHVWKDDALRRVIGLSVMVELFGFSHYTMVPVVARDVLRVGATGLGYLSAAGGIGAMLGTLAVAGLGDIKQKGALMWGITLAAGFSLIVFAASPWYLLSLGLALVAGGVLSAYDVLMQALVQLLTPDAVRGRVLSLYTLTFGFTSVGGYVAGLIATLTSVPLAIALGGGLMITYLISVARPLRLLRPMAETAPVPE